MKSKTNSESKSADDCSLSFQNLQQFRPPYLGNDFAPENLLHRQYSAVHCQIALKVDNAGTLCVPGDRVIVKIHFRLNHRRRTAPRLNIFIKSQYLHCRLSDSLKFGTCGHYGSAGIAELLNCQAGLLWTSDLVITIQNDSCDVWRPRIVKRRNFHLFSFNFGCRIAMLPMGECCFSRVMTRQQITPPSYNILSVQRIAL